MIPETYYNDDPEDRAWSSDLWTWLKEQPQDAWLLFARTANWDHSDGILESMISDPRCDIAITAYVFWHSNPDYYIKEGITPTAETLLGKIISNVESGFYRVNELYLNRYEVAVAAHNFIQERRKITGEPAFSLPRSLCGPFGDRMAKIPESYGLAEEQKLQEVFDNIDGWLPRSQEAYWEGEVRNVGIMAFLTLPDVPAPSERNLRSIDDVEYAELFFGPHEDYQTALEKLRATYSAPLQAHDQGTGANSSDDPLSTWKGWGRIYLWILLLGALATFAALIAHRLRTGQW